MVPFNFAYGPPVVNTLSPSQSNALVGNSVSILGRNFGPWASPATVRIGGLPCKGAIWQDDGKLTCTTRPDTVGAKNISVLVANRAQPVFYYELDGGPPAYPAERLELRCPSNSMGLNGEFCTKCQGYDPANPTMVGVQGALCPGGELDTDLVTARPGWWRYNSTSASQCQPNQVGRALHPTTNPSVTDPGCPVFVQCVPSSACLENNVCAGEGSGCASSASASNLSSVLGGSIGGTLAVLSLAAAAAAVIYRLRRDAKRKLLVQLPAGASTTVAVQSPLAIAKRRSK